MMKKYHTYNFDSTYYFISLEIMDSKNIRLQNQILNLEFKNS